MAAFSVKKKEAVFTIKGVYLDTGKENGNCYSILGVYWDTGTEIKTTIVYWWFIGRMEENMEITISIFGVYWDNGKRSGNYYRVLGVDWDTGKENGNYCSILRGILG